MKKIILIIIVAGLIVFGVYKVFLKKEEPSFSLVEVERGNISQEVSETGQVKKGENINLNFKNAGRIEKIYVEVGDNIKSGEPLAKLGTSELEIQLREDEAALAVSQAKLDKLLAGTSPEEIKLAETAVENAQDYLARLRENATQDIAVAQTTVDNAEQNLKDVKAGAKEDLAQAYGDALSTLDDSYLKIYNASNFTDLIYRTYFSVTDQLGLTVKSNKDQIKTESVEAKTSLDALKADLTNENTDTVLSEMKERLGRVYDYLVIIRNSCEELPYRNTVSSTHKDSLDTHKGYINSALTNVIDDEQSISLTKITNETNINSAQASLNAAEKNLEAVKAASASSLSKAEGDLKTAQDTLVVKKAGPRQEDVDLYQAQVKQAEAKVALLKNQIQEATLKSPVEGQITKVKKQIGETVQPMLQDIVIVLLPVAPLQIKVDIYEEDVVKISVGNPVDISLVAFPQELFQGKIISIDPAEKLIEGIVYYEATVGFNEMPEGLKPGMTADVIIKTASKEDVLVIPEDAVEKKDGTLVVQVLRSGESVEQEIETGLKGSDGMVEVVSGVAEGEEIILK